MKNTTNYYDVGLTIWKFIKSTGVLGAGAGAAVVFPEEGADLWDWLLFLALISPPVVTALKNWFKHGDKPKKNSMEHILADIRDNLYRQCWPLVLVGVLGLSGCATALPAVGGKTKYQVDFRDVTEAQSTTYRMDIRAPAGVDLAGLTGMRYTWAPDGSGEVSVNSEQTADTRGQAALIAEVNAQQMALIQGVIQATINALVPVVGQALEHDVRRAAIEAASRETDNAVE
jgi:hypothetical protein